MKTYLQLQFKIMKKFILQSNCLRTRILQNLMNQYEFFSKMIP